MADYPVVIKVNQRLIKRYHSKLGIGANYIRQLINLAFSNEIPHRWISQHKFQSGRSARAIGFGDENLTQNTKKQGG